MLTGPGACWDSVLPHRMFSDRADGFSDQLFRGLQGFPWMADTGGQVSTSPCCILEGQGQPQHCLATPGLTSEFADVAIGLQHVARETSTAVGPWGIEAYLTAGSLAPLHALIYVHAGQTILSKPIAWATPAPLWGKGPSAAHPGDTKAPFYS